MNTESKKDIKTKELMKAVSAVTKFISQADAKKTKNERKDTHGNQS
jgi:tellurite resistance protein